VRGQTIVGSVAIAVLTEDIFLARNLFPLNEEMSAAHALNPAQD
jgi:hypothetical protein